MTIPEIKETVLATARLARHHGRDLGPFIVPDLGEFKDVQAALDEAGIRINRADPQGSISRTGCGVIAVIRPRITKVGGEYVKSVDVIIWPRERWWKRLLRALLRRETRNERA
jgi:hypothetical protein